MIRFSSASASTRHERSVRGGWCHQSTLARDMAAAKTQFRASKRKYSVFFQQEYIHQMFLGQWQYVLKTFFGSYFYCPFFGQYFLSSKFPSSFPRLQINEGDGNTYARLKLHTKTGSLWGWIGTYPLLHWFFSDFSSVSSATARL